MSASDDENDEGAWDVDLEDDSDLGSSDGLEDSDDGNDDDGGDDDEMPMANDDDESERVAHPKIENVAGENEFGVDPRVVIHSEAILEEVRSGRRFVRYRASELFDPHAEVWSLPNERTSIRCWSCSGKIHPDSSGRVRFVRCPARNDIRTGRWELFGYFHGWGCALRYSIDRPTAAMRKSTALVGALARHMGYKGNIVPAPPVWLLEHFGGTMTLDEYLRSIDCEIGEIRGLFVRYPMVAVENIVCSQNAIREVDRHWSPSEFDRRRAMCAELDASPYEAVMPPPLFDEFAERHPIPDSLPVAPAPAPTCAVSDSNSLPDAPTVPSPEFVDALAASSSSNPGVAPPAPDAGASARRRLKANVSRTAPPLQFSADPTGGGVIVTTPTKRIRIGSLVRHPPPARMQHGR